MKRTLAAAAIGILGLGAAPAIAETCGGTYTVQRGDTLSGIADRLYKEAGKWTAIHNNNIATIGPKPNLLRVGMDLKLACLAGLPKGLPGGTPISDVQLTSAPVQVPAGDASVRKKINLLTGSDYAPFTHSDLHKGGMLTHVVDAAFAKAEPEQGYAIHWVNDWSSHLEPLLSNALLDVGFPWFQPDCANLEGNWRCENLLYSEPMFEMLQLFFVAAGSDMVFNSDADVIGRTLCRPEGYNLSDLDEEGRNWVAESKIGLLTPRSVKECFDLVISGEADAVALNEFTGRDVIKEHGLQEAIRILPQPVSITGLHVVVHKSHPQAQELLAMANDGLRGIRDTGEYQSIIEEHMARIWADY